MRGIVIEALAKIGPKAGAAVPVLVALIRKREPGWVAAVEALGRMGPPAKEAVPTLAELLKDRKYRDLAVEVLGQLGPVAKAAIPALEEAQHDPNTEFAVSVIKTLYRIRRD